MVAHFEPNQNTQEVIIVGLGGTGSQIARTVCRIIFDMRRQGIAAPQVTFVDPDIVEEKNIGRQMFTHVDVGQNKAKLLARRFSYALGFTVNYRDELFSAEWYKETRYIGDDSPVYGKNRIVVGCVDNHLARRELSRMDCVYIDCGNHFDAGQTIIGNSRNIQDIKPSYRDKDEWQYLPSPSLLFPELLEPEIVAEPAVRDDLSCADLVASGDQHLLVNEYVALAAGQYIYKLLHRQPITSFMTFVDSDLMTMKPIAISKENIEAYLPEAEQEKVSA